MVKTARGETLASISSGLEGTEISKSDERYVIYHPLTSAWRSNGDWPGFDTPTWPPSCTDLSQPPCIRRAFWLRPRENNPRRRLGAVAWVARERETGSGRLEAGRVRPRLESRPGVFGWKQSLGNHPEARRRFTSLSSIHPRVLLYRSLQQLHPLASASETERSFTCSELPREGDSKELVSASLVTRDFRSQSFLSPYHGFSPLSSNGVLSRGFWKLVRIPRARTGVFFFLFYAKIALPFENLLSSVCNFGVWWFGQSTETVCFASSLTIEGWVKDLVLSLTSTEFGTIFFWNPLSVLDLKIISSLSRIPHSRCITSILVTFKGIHGHFWRITLITLFSFLENVYSYCMQWKFYVHG